MKLIQRAIGKAVHVAHAAVAGILPAKGRVMMLHWVGDEMQDADTEPFRVSTGAFRRLAEWLKRQNCIRLEEWEGHNDFYALTIDDVPENFYHNAFPVLKEYEVPFTIFVNTSLLDTPGFITTGQLREMAAWPLCTVGSHGTGHVLYQTLDKAGKREHLTQSKAMLEKAIGRPVEIYAYPYGSVYACGHTDKHLATRVYKYAFGTIACPVTKPRLLPKYFLPRINVSERYINTLIENGK